MIISTELSGFGHYGIWSIVPYPVLEEFLKISKRFPEWEYPDFLNRGTTRTGIKASLINYNLDDGPGIRLGWLPFNIAKSMESISLLGRVAQSLSDQEKRRESLSKPILELVAEPMSKNDGWNVKANFGDPIWDIIESADFPFSLSKINKRIQLWWQDLYNDHVSGQYASVFNGVDGLTLQIYQPSGNGLWMVGSRQHSGGSYQICDHNTDSSTDALAHVYALCVILDHCRQQLPAV